MHSRIRLAASATCLLALCLGAAGFKIHHLDVTEDGRLVFAYSAEPGFYYILHAAENPGTGGGPVQLSLAEGAGVFNVPAALDGTMRGGGQALIND